MADTMLQLRRSGWDVIVGALLVLGGLVILANAAIATTVSIMFVGWIALIVGVLGLIACLFLIGKPGFWPAAISGGLLTVLGLFFLRNTGAAAVTLTLLAGLSFLVSGIVRLAASAQDSAYRLPLLVAGVISTGLGLIVLLNLFDASYKLIGILLGIQVIVDGVALMVVGRWHATPTAPTHMAAAH
jgi:membrane protein HdeD